MQYLFLAGALTFLSACEIPVIGGDSLSKAEKYAVEACALKLIDSNAAAGEATKSKKKWSSPSLTSEERWSYSDSILRIKNIRRAWANRVPSAAAAAQEDSAFLPLVEVTTQTLRFVDDVIAARDNGVSDFDFSRTHDPSEYNDALSRFRNECAGLSVRLNSR